MQDPEEPREPQEGDRLLHCQEAAPSSLRPPRSERLPSAVRPQGKAETQQYLMPVHEFWLTSTGFSEHTPWASSTLP